MAIFQTPDELVNAVGLELGTTGWHRVTQPAVDRFAAATGDRQWIHTDPVRAADGPFGGTIAHGFYVLSLIPMFSSQLMSVRGVALAVNYGADTIRFPTPAPVGARLRDAGEIVSVQTTSRGVKTTVRHTIEVDSDAKPACVADIVTLLIPQAPGR